jgi:predicted NBD/HSP70 family sugar kinase/DNA-binding transcriptional ArsR family regulator
MVSIPSGSLASLRERNRRRVVEVLRRRGLASRSDITRETGLSRTTVSSIVAAMQRDGLITERPEEPGLRTEGGRPPTMLAFEPTVGALVGIDFGHDRLRVAVSDFGYSVLAETGFALDVGESAAAAIEAAAAAVDDVLGAAGVARDRVLSAGVGLPGPIDPESGQVCSDSILPSWFELDPRVALEERLGIVTHLDNDANVGALGEWMFGAARGRDLVTYVRLSSGVGAGLILQGRIFRGAAGVAGELGHVLADPSGPICRCGNRGCLETLVSAPALCEQLERSHGELTVTALLELAAAGDRGCRRVIQDAARVVGRALADLCTTINPDVVVIGGELSAAGDLLLEPLRAVIRQHAIPAAVTSVTVVAGLLGERAELLGALALAGHASADALAAGATGGSPIRGRVS